ncbi:MAG: hypothetical protein HN968_10760 [Gammaproteobacteria bacterium]|nr:hypothetical protein [Gammaproteobacteria bacterium]MBT7024190.1 hypothetical protein [Gammaproteobacteria bacterium]
MVRVHRERINRGEGSLLMGLNLFSEGVDLPGDLCTHLVITKLPFPYFSGAVDRMEAEWLESMGQHPFMARSLPAASMRLIQMTGRLLRTETDHGRITILDYRVISKGYGADLLSGLPPYKRNFATANDDAHR